MTRALRALSALTLLAVPLVAQDPIADRMLGLSGKDRPQDNSTCKLSGGDFHVASAGTYLQTGLTTPVAGNKVRALTNGRDQALQGIQGGSAGSSKAWYYYARTSLQLGDLAAADSAFAHLLKLAPACADEVDQYRKYGWGSLMNAAVTARNAHQADSSVFFSRAANRVDPTRPQGWYTIGAYFMDQQKEDSAGVYMEKAFMAPSDTTSITQGVRQAAAFQYGVIMYNARNYAEAARGFGMALKLKADDADAKRNLVAALRQAGMTDSATKVASTMTAETGDAAGGADQMFNIGVDQFNAHKYADAAATFEKILATQPNNRDALYNLANAYLGIAPQTDSALTTARRSLTAHPRDPAAKTAVDSATAAQANVANKLLATALKLQGIDPLSFEVLQLVANGYRLKHDQPNLLRAATALGGATVSLTVPSGGFAPAADKATLTLAATGREGRDANDRVVHGAPIPIVVEFLDKDGAVVTTAEAVIPVLAKDATQNVVVTGTGAGITAWRYHKK